jgi:hypothetical protein
MIFDQSGLVNMCGARDSLSDGHGFALAPDNGVFIADRHDRLGLIFADEWRQLQTVGQRVNVGIPVQDSG